MAQSTLEVRRDIERIRAELDETLDALGDHVRPARIAQRRTRGMRRAFSSARERVMGSVSSAGGSVQGAGSQLTDTASSAVDRAAEAPQWVAQETRGNPIAAGIVAFGVGVLLGSLAPPSRVERDAAGAMAEKMSQRMEPVRQQALDSAASIREEATGAARDAIEHVKDDAHGAVEDVQTAARQAASEVGDEAHQGVREVAEARNRPV